ncbi:MAG: hypothetical protein WA133_11060 [Syntrophales bacterium]
MQKESGVSRWCLWVTGWFYDDIKDIIEICRVAAYLNMKIMLTSPEAYPILRALFRANGIDYITKRDSVAG